MSVHLAFSHSCMPASHTLLAGGCSYAELLEWAKTNCIQGMPVREKGLSFSLQANKCYLANGLWHKKVLQLSAQ